MMRFLPTIALALLLVDVRPIFGGEIFANGPPAWNDRASAYLAMPHEGAAPTGSLVAQANAEDHAVHTRDHALGIQPAAYDERVLAPSTESRSGQPPTGRRDQVRGGNQPGTLTDFGLPLTALYTVLSALAIVVGLFLICAWMLRRAGRTAANALPTDVVSVLGRVPLTARQFAQLLRIGNKLVLVSMTPDRVEPLAEVTDPVEVDRIVGLCQQLNPHSTTKAFEQVFRQLSREPARGGFLGEDSQHAPFAATSPVAPPVSLSNDLFRLPRSETARA